MPNITGKIGTVTRTPTTVTEAWVSALKPRPTPDGIITAEPTRVTLTEDGGVSFFAEPGPAALTLIHTSSRPGPGFTHIETIPLGIGETESLANAVAAGQTLEETTTAEIYRTSSEIQTMLVEIRGHSKTVNSDAKASAAAASAAAGSEQRAATSASAAADSEQRAATSASAAADSEQRAATSASAAADSEQRAKDSETKAKASQNSAKESEDQAAISASASQASAVQSSESANRAATSESNAAASERRASQIVIDKLPDAGIMLKHFHSEVEQRINTIVRQAVNSIVDGASENYDTLRELEQLLKNENSAIATLVSQIATKLSADEAVKTYATIASLSGKANTIHNHSIADVVGLMEALRNKIDNTDDRLTNRRAPTAHTHSASDITGFTTGTEANTLLGTDGSGHITVANPTAPGHPVPKSIFDRETFSREHTYENVTWIRRGKTGWFSGNKIDRLVLNRLRFPDWAVPAVTLTIPDTEDRKITVSTAGEITASNHYYYNTFTFNYVYPIK